MAKVSLRIYTREIESLIEKGHTDEAIAHCRHILETFPKHLETYRLLGKAYLESRRYKEAVDILGRVLMCVPDDFVAHVSLSIIRDEEDKLDDAIWHMERASEVQPSNAAIQGELRRLYGRRDGMEPPKIRMTRGALAHMYVQGELYPQAISEIRAVLAKDPQRTDMQILLATSFLKSGQESAASDLCNQLLKDFPYCYDANRIMVDLLPAIGGVSENTQVYRMRVGELDPYAAFVKGSIFQINEVPDAAVNLERLEYSGDEFSAGQAWSSSLGIGFDSSAAPALEAASSDDQPDWLKSGGFTDETPQFESAPASSLQGISTPQKAFFSEAKDDIPDFLRDVGWAESNTLERPSSIFDEDSSEKLVPADLPDWLKRQDPVSNHLDAISETRPDAVQPVETPKWATSELRKIQPELSDTPQAQPPSTAPDWLSGLDGRKASDDFAQPVALPGWSDGIENTQASVQSADIPDWLRDIESKNVLSPSNDTLDALAHEQDDAVAWLESLTAKQGAKPEELVTDPGKGNENPSEWVAPAHNIDRQTPVKQPYAQEQDDAVAWLESLAVKHGAKPEELVSDPSKRSEIPPTWVQQAQSIGETQPVPSREPSKSNWVAAAQHIGEEFFAEFEKTSTAPPASDKTGMWLRNLEQKEKQEELTEEQKLQGRDVPEWLSDTRQSINAGDQSVFIEQQPAVQGSGPPNWISPPDEKTPAQEKSFADQNLNNQDLSNWLSSLDDEPGLDIDPELIQVFERPPFPDTYEKQIGTQPPQSDLPDKLGGREAKQDTEDESWKKPIASTPTEAPAPVTLTADLPDSLQSEHEKTSAPEQAGDDDTAPWLHRELWETEATPQEPKPTSPSDWHPLEEKPVEAPKPKQAIPAPKPKPMTHSSQSRTHPTMKFSFSPEPIEPIRAPSAGKKSGISASQPKADGQSNVDALDQAKDKLDRGDIPAALDHYRKLIKKGKHLEETIRDLTESIYRYPVEVGIWQTLGDAYMRANRLMEALESYNKAEELIR